jgi:phosphoenolpyruvate carboxykinase (ATP)
MVENANPVENKREINFHDVSVTENARLCYPIEHLSIFKNPPIGKHPKNVILLTCDMEGVLPLISKLNYEQALFFYLNGYTTKLNNKEIDPKSSFETCYFGDSLMLHPNVYADLFYERLKDNNSKVWLLNTGYLFF